MNGEHVDLIISTTQLSSAPSRLRTEKWLLSGSSRKKTTAGNGRLQAASWFGCVDGAVTSAGCTTEFSASSANHERARIRRGERPSLTTTRHRSDVHKEMDDGRCVLGDVTWGNPVV